MVDSPTRVALRQDRARAEVAPVTAPAPTATPAAEAAPAENAAPRRHVNPKAAWPYVIGLAIFALEAIFIV